MKRTLAILAASIVFVGWLENPAHSATALWGEVGAWSIYGNTDNNSCAAEAEYLSGYSLTIVFFDDETSVAIHGVSVKAGENYSAIVKASTGESGVLDAQALDGDTVLFGNVNKSTVRALANARSIFIRGLGSFDLTDSKLAMASAWECYETLNSI